MESVTAATRPLPSEANPLLCNLGTLLMDEAELSTKLDVSSRLMSEVSSKEEWIPIVTSAKLF